MSQRPQPAPPSPPAASVHVGWAAAIIAGAGLLVYANTLNAPFVFDDGPAITGNPTIRHLWPLSEALSPPLNGGGVAARPLVNLSFALNFAIGGLDVRGYHAVNLLLHVFAGLALFGLVRRSLLLPLLRARWGARALPVAFGTALLWTVHPLLTEAVTCTVQRNELMVGLALLLMLYALARAADSPRPGRWLAASFTAGLGGMFCKEIMVAAPLLAFAYQALLVDGSWVAAGRQRKKFLAALALTWVPLALLVAHNRTRNGAAGFDTGVAWWEYALTQCRAVTHYLALCFWPHPLVVDYGDAVVKNPADVWLQGLFLLVLALVVVVAAVRKVPAAFAGLAFFGLLAPSSSILPLATQTVAEHRMYLPLAAVIVVIVAGAWAALGRAALAAGVILAAALATVTLARDETYRTAVALWRDTVAHAPDNARAHNNLGSALAEDGQVPAAQAEFERAVQLRPDYDQAHFNLGNVLARTGRFAPAIGEYRTSLRLAPDVAEPHLNLGNVFAMQQRWDEARVEFAAAARLDPGSAPAQNNLGNVLLTQGRPADALEHFERALQLQPDQAVHFSCALALAAVGRLPEAIAQLREAIRLAPQRADAHERLGQFLAATGARPEAIRELREALRLRPDYPEARHYLDRLEASP